MLRTLQSSGYCYFLLQFFKCLQVYLVDYLLQVLFGFTTLKGHIIRRCASKYVFDYQVIHRNFTYRIPSIRTRGFNFLKKFFAAGLNRGRVQLECGFWKKCEKSLLSCVVKRINFCQKLPALLGLLEPIKQILHHLHYSTPTASPLGCAHTQKAQIFGPVVLQCAPGQSTFTDCSPISPV